MALSGILLASYLALWLVATVQTLVLLELLRQIGILHRRVGPGPGALLSGEGLERGALAPPFEARDVRTGEMIVSELLSGRMTLLVFLSASCHVCRSLASDLRVFSREHARDVAVLVICTDTKDRCVAFAEEHKLGVLVLDDHEQFISSAYRVRGTPSAVLLDAEGRVRIHGIPNDLDQLEGLLREEGTVVLNPRWVKKAEEDAVFS